MGMLGINLRPGETVTITHGNVTASVQRVNATRDLILWGSPEFTVVATGAPRPLSLVSIPRDQDESVTIEHQGERIKVSSGRKRIGSACFSGPLSFVISRSPRPLKRRDAS